jgi:IclR family transcriptional regulator, blcABC operon repressor
VPAWTNTRDLTDEGQQDARSRVPAISRAAAVVELIIAEGPLRLSELARRLGVPKSSMSNLCMAMAEVGWLRRAEDRFAMGARLMQYGKAYFGALDPVREFQSVCDEFPGGLVHTTQLAVLGTEGTVIYLARRQGRRGVTVASEIGQPAPAHCTGAGKALLAELPDYLLTRQLTKPLSTLTTHSISDPQQLLKELEVIRQQGYALDDEETLEGVCCVARALPAVGSLQRQVAVSVTILKAQLKGGEEQVVHEQLDAIHRALSTRLGRSDERLPA